MRQVLLIVLLLAFSGMMLAEVAPADLNGKANPAPAVTDAKFSVPPDQLVLNEFSRQNTSNAKKLEKRAERSFALETLFRDTHPARKQR